MARPYAVGLIEYALRINHDDGFVPAFSPQYTVPYDASMMATSSSPSPSMLHMHMHMHPHSTNPWWYGQDQGAVLHSATHTKSL